MNYEEKYKQALERASKLRVQNPFDTVGQMVEHIFPELKESEDGENKRISKEITQFLKQNNGWNREWLAWLEKQGEPEDKGEISDGYHTFNELYRYRMLYNAAFFNLLPKELVHKSKKHHDGKECFGGGWFIVMANLPTGQISNHYELKDWDLFQIPEKDVADEWDGHTPQEAADRLHKYLLEKQGEQKPYGQRKECEDCQFNYAGECKGFCQMKRDEQNPVDKVEPKFKVGDWVVYDHRTYQVVELPKEGYINLGLRRNGKVEFAPSPYCRHWTIQDAKDGDVLACNINKAEIGGDIEKLPNITPTICIYQNVVKDKDYIHSYCSLYDGSSLVLQNRVYYNTFVHNIQPATEEQRELLFQKMKEEGWEYDNEKKELKKIKSKKLNADKVIEWLNNQACQGWIEDVEVDKFVAKFKQDFGL